VISFDAAELGKLANDLRTAGPKAATRTETEVLTEGSKLLFDKSQASVPVATGELKASGRRLGGAGWREVRYDAAHARYVEFGTYKDAPQPYLYNHVGGIERDMLAALEDIADDTL
jgi:HK97 gp10 family phage protein